MIVKQKIQYLKEKDQNKPIVKIDFISEGFKLVDFNFLRPN
jgi:hypothetical protein